MTFGLMSRFYENIRHDKEKKEIARTYGLSPDNLASLLRHCVYLRNLCAHHSRLWNRRFTVTVALPRKCPSEVIPNLFPEEDRRIYNTLVLLTHIIGVIDPPSTWAHRLVTQLLALDGHFIPRMGFPSDWKTRPLWAKLIGKR
jgi:abortive infection bacteriophage resistance protein